jgi:hypothetical protein
MLDMIRSSKSNKQKRFLLAGLTKAMREINWSRFQRFRNLIANLLEEEDNIIDLSIDRRSKSNWYPYQNNNPPLCRYCGKGVPRHIEEGKWDGVSYVDEFFCSRMHAEQFGFAMARDGKMTASYARAIEGGKYRRTKN